MGEKLPDRVGATSKALIAGLTAAPENKFLDKQPCLSAIRAFIKLAIN